MSFCEVHILIGPPAIGKSEYARTLLSQYPNSIFISTDATRAKLYGSESIDGDLREVFDFVYKELKLALEQKKTVIYEATNLDPEHRFRLLRRLKNWGATRVIGHTFQVSLSVCLQRNRTRIRVVPEAKVHQMYTQWENFPPIQEEGFDEINWHTM